jgi:hypothetical protein
MRSMTIRFAIVAALIALAGAKVAARQPAASAPSARTTTAAETSAQTTQPSAVKTKASAAKTKATTTNAAKTTKTKAAKSNATKTKKKTAGKAAKTTAAKAPKKPSPVSKAASVPPATMAGPWKPNNPIAQELSSKPVEVARARRVLPAGTDLNAATAGFRNYSQFAAAINATESKGLDYGKLKALMTGVTMDGTRTNQPTMSLSQATQTLHGTATTPPGGSL